jgi:uncharacterized protein YjbI with pentapeptide repeats
MLYEGKTIHEPKLAKNILESNDGIFRYCSFESVNLEGGTYDGVFLACEFCDVDFYWAFFNVALLANCSFERCTFRGTSFAGCRLVECTFTKCRFLKDNLGGSCDARDTKLFDCVAEDCEGWSDLFPQITTKLALKGTRKKAAQP